MAQQYRYSNVGCHSRKHLEGIPIHDGYASCSIADNLYEAAELDGCGVIQRFLHVTLPGIMPVLSTTLMLEIMWCFKHFTLIWNLTKGGPVDATRVVSIDIYRTGFDYMRFGESSTRAVFVFIIIIILTLLQKKMKRSDV